ncbi:hypothetical protein JW948_01555 [bacterium]|nr:hypothetical protein [bacterium]
MKKLICLFLIIWPAFVFSSGLTLYRLVWDTGKIAAFGAGAGFNFLGPGPSDAGDGKERSADDRVLGPVIDAEIGITGYEYSAGIRFGKMQHLSSGSFLFTVFAGRAKNWKDLKTNIGENHFVAGIRLNHRLTELALKYHTDFENNTKISVQLGLGG